MINFNFQKLPCPCCNYDRVYLVGNKNNFDIYRCMKCKTIFCEKFDRFLDSDLKEYYDNYYSESNLKVPEFLNLRMEKIFFTFNKFKKYNRLLDIGFGSGLALVTGKKQGWDVYGVEVSQPAILHLQKLGIGNLFLGNLIEANYPDNYFDVVLMIEVLEHIKNPGLEIKEIYRILRPGGLFWATTPNSNGISFKILGLDWTVISPPEHLQLFAPNGIKLILNTCKFSKTKIYTHGVNPYEILKFFRKENIKNFNRVSTSYQLNERLNSRKYLSTIKSTLNFMLNITRTGDNLKIIAIK